MSKRRKFFHWILVAFFILFSLSGFAVGSMSVAMLNLVLAAIALPYGAVSELTGKRRVAKWIVSILLMCICVASLARSSNSANSGSGSTESVATERAATER